MPEKDFLKVEALSPRLVYDSVLKWVEITGEIANKSDKCYTGTYWKSCSMCHAAEYASAFLSRCARRFDSCNISFLRSVFPCSLCPLHGFNSEATCFFTNGSNSAWTALELADLGDWPESLKNSCKVLEKLMDVHHQVCILTNHNTDELIPLRFVLTKIVESCGATPDMSGSMYKFTEFNFKWSVDFMTDFVRCHGLYSFCKLIEETKVWNQKRKNT